MPERGCFQRPFIAARASPWVGSPPATMSFRCWSWALMISSADWPSRRRSHGPPSCLQVIVFMRRTYDGARSARFSDPARFRPASAEGAGALQGGDLLGVESEDASQHLV